MLPFPFSIPLTSGLASIRISSSPLEIRCMVVFVFEVGAAFSVTISRVSCFPAGTVDLPRPRSHPNSALRQANRSRFGVGWVARCSSPLSSQISFLP